MTWCSHHYVMKRGRLMGESQLGPFRLASHMLPSKPADLHASALVLYRGLRWEGGQEAIRNYMLLMDSTAAFEHRLLFCRLSRILQELPRQLPMHTLKVWSHLALRSSVLQATRLSEHHLPCVTSLHPSKYSCSILLSSLCSHPGRMGVLTNFQ